MNDLIELINQTVTALICVDGETFDEVQCKIEGFKIDSFYFEEKGEPIYITVDLVPLDAEKYKDDWELFSGVSLDYIRR